MREIGTDEVMSKYSISRHNLNILIEHSPEFIGYLRQDRVWNGQAYINKNMFDSTIKHTKEEVEQKILEIKAKIKADKKANATDEEIINARKRTLEKHNRKQIKGMMEHEYKECDLIYVNQIVRAEIEKLENIEYIKDKANETARILKSKEPIKLDIIIYSDEYNHRVDDSVPIYWLEVGEEIEWEKIRYEVIANTELLVYRYELNNEIVGIDYKILKYENEDKTEVLERYITYKY